MKNILILISFLLLSSPLYGDNHKGETLYVWETSSGKEWKYFGDKETHQKYEGQVENGVPNGLGVLIFPYNGGSIVGEWKNGDVYKIEYRTNKGSLWGKFEMGKNGKGTLFYYLGEGEKRFVGEMKFGLEWNGSIYETFYNEKDILIEVERIKIVNGKRKRPLPNGVWE